MIFSALELSKKIGDPQDLFFFFRIHDLWMPDVARWVDEKNQKLGERRPMMGFIKTV